MIDATTLVAAFDVDGTLTTRDCVVPFIRRVAGTARVAGGLARHPVGIARAAMARNRDDLKALATRVAFTGRPLDEVQALGRTFAHEVHSTWLRRAAVDRLHGHRDDGAVVALVSASYEVYLEPLGALLGADHVLGTRLEVGPNGRLTGRLDGANCRGPEKVRRLHECLAEHHGGRSAVRLVAYGDSPGDRDLLDDADEAHWIRGRR